MKQTLQKHWPSGVIFILVGVTAYLSQGKLESYAEADKACRTELREVAKTQTIICSRVDKLETTLPFINKTMEKNTNAIEKMSDNVEEIKMLLYRGMKGRQNNGE
jgi:CRISPR/Cas system CSM-associated protein Csm4 (group 5 of RAMP superfamily)